ncbi:Pseudouridine-5'-monophosphatase [Fasciola hepatica]|uniref:pseudouridine 5'-phosphatase n=1 Tax=Fasciola hepatica TaxID=6192 RepID=A0A2H1BT90_FASHE|nr:Pseudouridine-5'-monophosphatase [Fasciola hepatica]
MPPVTHVIFDVDGLLLDTEVVYTAVSTEILQKYGLTLTYDVKRKLMGRKPIEAARILVTELSAPFTPEEWRTLMHEKLTPEQWYKVPSLPGAERLVRHLAKHGIPMAAATGCASVELAQKMKNHQNIWEKLDHAVASGDDPEVLYGKPNPDIFLIAARRFSSPPKDMNTVLVFEDSPLGIEAAVAAGMQAVWVPQPDEPPADAPESIAPSDKHRVTRFKSLTDFQPQLFGIPAF